MVSGPKPPSSKVVFQAIATIVANIAMLSQGCAIGWVSPSLPILRSDKSPLTTGPLNIREAAWVGSLLSLAAIVGTAIFGYLTKWIGSKRSLVVCVIPGFISWSILFVATHPWHLYASRLAAGIAGGGIFLCIPMYVAEIASEHVRGRLASIMSISFNLGVVTGYVAGRTLDLQTAPLVMGVLPIIFVCLFIWLPSTPQFLLANNQYSKAEQSLRFYRNCRGEDRSHREEVEFQCELQKLITISQQNAKLPPIGVADFRTAEAIRGMLIGPVLMAAVQFSGAFTLANYAVTIFNETGSTVDPSLSAIIMGSTQLVGTIFASSLIDRLGRKFLLLISMAGAALTLLATGGYCYMNTQGYDVGSLNLLPVITLSAFIFVTAIGMNPVPYVVTAEVLPPKIRRVGMTVCVCSVSVFAFIMLSLFPYMLDWIGLDGCMFTFAAVSSLAFVFTYFVIKETNGINLDQVATVEPITLTKDANSVNENLICNLSHQTI